MIKFSQWLEAKRVPFKKYSINPTNDPNQVSRNDFYVALDYLDENNLIRPVTSPEGNVFFKGGLDYWLISDMAKRLGGKSLGGWERSGGMYPSYAKSRRVVFKRETVEQLFKFLHISMAKYSSPYEPNSMDWWHFITPEEIRQEALNVINNNQEIAALPLTGRNAARRIAVEANHFSYEQLNALSTLPHERMSRATVFNQQLLRLTLNNIFRRHGSTRFVDVLLSY